MPVREILYRGKRKDNGEWVYGYPMRDTAPCSAKARDACVCPHDGSVSVIIFWDDDFHEYDYEDVVPETMGEYTGLTDKNGVKIFDGDILESHYDDGYPDDSAIETIVWHRNAWCIKEGRSDPNQSTEDDILPFSRVIGNIHDNPELLEGDAE